MEIENKNICGKCGGKCCKNVPGSCSPEDFGSKEEVMEKLKTGRYAIDWWEGDVNESNSRMKSYYVRPAVKGMEKILFDPTWGGECTFLKRNGCELKLEDRPKECRVLIPNENFEQSEGDSCYMEEVFSKRQASIEWLIYENFFFELEGI